MKIYTKQGDLGQTGLLGNERRSKADPRIELYGTADELNSSVGWTLAQLNNLQQNDLQETAQQLKNIQKQLFVVGSNLASLKADRERYAIPNIQTQWISDLEQWIDHTQSQLPELKSFILPGGHPAAASMHCTRTLCRRFERRLSAWLQGPDADLDQTILAYTNRLSDYFFVCARLINKHLSHNEELWP